jgi:hypothetical protein
VLFKKQKGDWLLLMLIVAGLFLYASYQPRLRLRPDMPAEFVDQSADAFKNSGEQKIAQAYWGCLVDDVQWRYGFGHSLPAEPPVEFNLGTQGKGSVSEDSATRMRYWHRAQHLWYLNSSWKRQYEWSFDWSTDWLQDGADWLHRTFGHLGGG